VSQPEREWQVTFDDGDPLHEELQAYLRAIRVKGRYSPVRRILARWAGLGYLLEVGRIPGGIGADAAAIFDALESSGLLSIAATPDAVAEALASVAGQARPAAARPRLDIAEAQREIAAITASADAIDFE
jgi:hypothetical protein